MEQDYKKIIIHRGNYYDACHPDDVSHLLLSEKQSPAELVMGDDRQLHYLIRDLFLLACKASINTTDQQYSSRDRILVKYARDLLYLFHNKNS